MPEYILSMICKASFHFLRGDELIDEQVYRGLTEEYDLGYQADLGGSFSEKVQGGVKRTCSGDACQHVHQDKPSLFAFFTGTIGLMNSRLETWNR